jgi:hypothetical protein
MQGTFILKELIGNDPNYSPIFTVFRPKKPVSGSDSRSAGKLTFKGEKSVNGTVGI